MIKLAILTTLLTGIGMSAQSQVIISILRDTAITERPPGTEMDSILQANNTDSVVPGVNWSRSGGAAIDWQQTASYKKPFPYKSMILPGALIAYGFAELHSKTLRQVNLNVKDEIWTDGPHKTMMADNYLMFAPALAVYGLNAAGIHGKHDFKDRTMLLLMSNLFANATVFSLKGSMHQLRPDGSAYTSFPSGHTAEAFANAEFMRLEYKDVSPWYGVAGYAMATTTGLLRLYNNKHWVSDVVAGAGIGIASTRLAYWLYPIMQHAFGKGKSSGGTVLMPTYQNGSFGL